MSARLVLDNSVSVAWCFSDENNSYTEGVFQSVAKDGGAVAPALWPIELANALVVAERKKRITTEQREAFLKISEIRFSLDQILSGSPLDRYDALFGIM